MTLRPDAPAWYPDPPSPQPPFMYHPHFYPFHPIPGIHYAQGFYPIVPRLDYNYFPPPPYQPEWYDASLSQSHSQGAYDIQSPDDQTDRRDSGQDAIGEAESNVMAIAKPKKKKKKGKAGRRGDNATRREKAKEKRAGERVGEGERAMSEPGAKKEPVTEKREGRSQSMSEKRVKKWSEL